MFEDIGSVWLELCLLIIAASAASAASAAANSTQPQPGHLTDHFRQWLTTNGYNASALARDDIPGGSFGGRRLGSDSVTRQPVVFVHGNSDRAWGGLMGGWSNSVRHFLSRGYTNHELYGTTWGSADKSQAQQQAHTAENLQHIRTFITAVLHYTEADKVDIIAHSMGVTLTRGAILGGRGLGVAITDRVDTFVAIAGANYGLVSCYLVPNLPTCNPLFGFYPGLYNPLLHTVTGRSRYLDYLLRQPAGFEGDYRFAIWSPDDELIKFNCIVYGLVTCRFPGMTAERVIPGLTHLQVKSQTAWVQFAMVTEHSVGV